MKASSKLGIVPSAVAAMLLAAWPGGLMGQELGGGIRADVALASFRNEDVDQSRRIGMRIGIFGELELPGPLDLLGEVVYANKGTKVSGASEALSLEYIEVPLAVKLSMGSSPVFLIVGPAFAFLVDSPFGDGEGYGDFDIGALGGVGIDTMLGTLPVAFDVRYTTGFSKIFDFGPGDSDTDDRNQVISFGVGIKLF